MHNVSYTVKEIFGGFANVDVFTEMQRFVQNSVVHDSSVPAVERWQTVQHLVEYGPQTPPIHRTTIRLSYNQLSNKPNKQSNKT